LCLIIAQTQNKANTNTTDTDTTTHDHDQTSGADRGRKEQSRSSNRRRDPEVHCVTPAAVLMSRVYNPLTRVRQTLPGTLLAPAQSLHDSDTQPSTALESLSCAALNPSPPACTHPPEPPRLDSVFMFGSRRTHARAHHGSYRENRIRGLRAVSRSASFARVEPLAPRTSQPCPFGVVTFGESDQAEASWDCCGLDMTLADSSQAINNPRTTHHGRVEAKHELHAMGARSNRYAEASFHSYPHSFSHPCPRSHIGSPSHRASSIDPLSPHRPHRLQSSPIMLVLTVQTQSRNPPPTLFSPPRQVAWTPPHPHPPLAQGDSAIVLKSEGSGIRLVSRGCCHLRVDSHCMNAVQPIATR
jgi:hypothetical protein